VPTNEGPAVNVHWTIESLYVHLSRIIHDMEKSHEDAKKARDALDDSKVKTIETALKAVEDTAKAALQSAISESAKSEKSIEERLKGTNEWRATVERLITDCMPRKEAEVQFTAIKEALSELATTVKANQSRLEGVRLGEHDTQKAHRDNSSLYIAIIAAILAAVGLFIANYHKA
jgi:hypothetical protein